MDDYSVVVGMKNADIHIALIPTGLMSMVVNIAGAIPFASQGSSSERSPKQTRMLLIVRKDSSYKSLKDLLNKQIAHVSHTSNTGDTVPRAIFTSLEFKPDIDYIVRYSGRHDRSILGVLYGFYDGAAVSGAIFEQMALRGEVSPDLFRSIYTSKKFPVASFTHSSQLNYKLSQKISSCFFNYHFPEEMVYWLGASDRFYPINYKKDWSTVRRFNAMAAKHFDNAQLEQLRDE
jgi:phosphonate transport system substrate-binding protein